VSQAAQERQPLFQPRAGGVEVGGELGDLVAETVQLCDGLSSRANLHEVAS
jgi:hypothetical protein